MDNFVEIIDVSFSHDNRKIFSNINLTIPRGKITAIMGPSGCGKTTLLHLIGGRLVPNYGKALINGVDIHSLDTAGLYQIRKSMGLLFQSGALFTGMSVFENVAFSLREHTRFSESIIRNIVLMQLEAVGLRGARNLMPNELSGGMARRVALARALILSPQLMMYDEPFAGQDPITMGILTKLIKNLSKALNLTSIVVSHDVDETLSIADYVYLIANGQIVGEGTPEQIKQHNSPLITQFTGGIADGPIPFNYPARDYREDLEL